MNNLEIGENVSELRNLTKPGGHHRLHHSERATYGSRVVVTGQCGA